MPTVRRRLGLLAALLASAIMATAAPAVAQKGVIGGTVMRDSSGHALGEAIISVPALNISTRTNFNGEFRIEVPAGKHELMIRHVGFAPFTRTVEVKAGQAIDDEFILSASPVSLDSQVIVDKAPLAEPNLREFEERRKLGFGHFIDKDELRKVAGDRPLMNFIAGRIPGLTMYRPDQRGRPLDYYLSSGRGSGAFNAGSRCPIAIWIDGTVFFTPGRHMGPGDPPDISKFSTEDYSAVEYYANGATLPPQYNMTQNDCGTLLLWRRYKR